MVDTHNEEYGFARNLAGLRWLLLAFSLAGTAGCAFAWRFQHGSVLGCVISICLLVYAVAMFFWLPNYVERAGDRYAESIFSIPPLSGVAKTKTAKGK